MPRSIGPDTYTFVAPCITVSEALCALAHQENEKSGAYCIRHHPHDECIQSHCNLICTASAI
jgi:hypothetical protein